MFKHIPFGRHLTEYKCTHSLDNLHDNYIIMMMDIPSSAILWTCLICSTDLKNFVHVNITYIYVKTWIVKISYVCLSIKKNAFCSIKVAMFIKKGK